jgi:hypothetical protein
MRLIIITEINANAVNIVALFPKLCNLEATTSCLIGADLNCSTIVELLFHHGFQCMSALLMASINFKPFNEP